MPDLTYQAIRQLRANAKIVIDRPDSSPLMIRVALEILSQASYLAALHKNRS